MYLENGPPLITRLHTKAMALSLGLVSGVGLCGLTLIADLRRIPEDLSFLGALLPGYSVSIGGSLAGLVYGLFAGMILGGSFSWLYNRLFERFLRLQSASRVSSSERPRNPQCVGGEREHPSDEGMVSPGTQGPHEESNAKTESIEKASKLWGERARLRQDAAAPILSWTECQPVLRLYVNPTISGTGDVNWMIYVAKKYFPQPVHHALSIGSGDGCLERHALHLNVAERFDAFDVSPEAVEVSRAKARDFGCAHRVAYEVADLNHCRFDPRKYDAVFASMALHHIVEVEHVTAQIAQSLTPGGLFIVHEYVGPDQFQWTDTQLRLANELLLQIPERYRTNLSTGRLKDRIVRPTREEMTAGDPTEAIRSSRIVPLAAQVFEIIERVDFGGTLLHLVLADIAGNFHSESEDIAILQSLFEFEAKHLREGVISSDFTLIVARKRT